MIVSRPPAARKARADSIFGPIDPAGNSPAANDERFVPPGFGARDRAYLVDRKFQPPYTGTQSILALGGGPLLRAGIRPGDPSLHPPAVVDD